MAEIDKFASLLIEEAKRFYELASETSDADARSAHLHAALMLGFCSLEAHVNAVAEEIADRTNVTLHERGVLIEKEVRLEEGVFIEKGLRIYRLEERLLLLHKRFGRIPFKKTAAIPNTLGTAIKLRNSLTHPKGVPLVDAADIRNALIAIIETIDNLYQAIYRRRLPAAARGLHSKLSF